MHLIKKLLSAVIPLSMVLSMPVMAREWAEIKSSGTLIAATEGAFAPFNYYEGKKLTDLPNVVTLSGYGESFAQAAAESVDIIVCYADGRNDYEAAWVLPTGEADPTGKAGMGRTDSIWNELNVIGVTELYYFAGIIKRQNFQTFQTYLVVCILYFILTFISQFATSHPAALFASLLSTGGETPAESQ